jgi:hypothetical protein
LHYIAIKDIDTVRGSNEQYIEIVRGITIEIEIELAIRKVVLFRDMFYLLTDIS